MLKRKPHHRGFKKKTFEEMSAAKSKFQSSKSGRRLEKDKWNDEWKRDHAHLKFCWSCGIHGGASPDDTITMAHALKQRFIVTEQDGKRAAWLCWREHRALDEAQGSDVHARMAEFIDGLIEKMKTR